MQRLMDVVTDLDPSRPFIPSSMSNYTQYNPQFALAPKDGPYGILLPAEFSRRNPGLLFWNGTRADALRLGFQPEIGSISVPMYDSLRRWMSPAAREAFPGVNVRPGLGVAGRLSR